MKTLFVIATLFSATIWAHDHREQEAHEHGAGTLSIAFDDAKGKVEFKAAAEGILGFEHAAKSVKDKALLAVVIANFEKNITSLVQMDSSLNCQFSKDLIGQVPEKGHEGSGEHSDFAANFNVTCAKSPVGTSIIFDFTSLKKMKDIDVTLLAGNIQKSAELKSKPVKVDLK